MNCVKCGKNQNINIKITDNQGTNTYCPNCLIESYLKGELNLENNPVFVDDVTNQKGAVKFKSDDEIYILEKERMLRLIAHNLEPEEYFALTKKYSANNFELHSDFYDDFDGEALQPII